MEHPFGHSGSAVLAVPSPNLLPTLNLLTGAQEGGGAEWGDHRGCYEES